VIKYNRAYTLIVGTANGGSVTVPLPFTCTFDITRNDLSSANVAQIKVYNLSPQNRNQIRFNIMDTGDYRPVILQAGYGSNISTIFKGSITQAWSDRSPGDTNFITTIESFDSGYAFQNGIINMTFPAGTAISTVIATLANSLPYTNVGIIGSYPGTLQRAFAANGNAIDILRDLTGGGVFIDNSTVNILGNTECLNGILGTIDDSVGLLGTPIREQSTLNFDMIFEPRLQIGQYVTLNSSTGQNYNGNYKIIGVKHRGMISGAVCGDAITSVRFFYPPGGPAVVASQQ
jgi:hypothetical protein